MSRQEEFKKYVEDQELIEQFSNLFVSLYDKKMPQKQDADRLVKDFFCPKQIAQMRDSIENYKKENELLKKQINDLKQKIKIVKDNSPKRKVQQQQNYYQN
ncbi:hypothetical protein ABPG72_005008 [Tetrahymena utriculariae]